MIKHLPSMWDEDWVPFSINHPPLLKKKKIWGQSQERVDEEEGPVPTRLQAWCFRQEDRCEFSSAWAVVGRHARFFGSGGSSRSRHRAKHPLAFYSSSPGQSTVQEPSRPHSMPQASQAQRGKVTCVKPHSRGL